MSRRCQDRILVVGSGGREHALVWALQERSPEPLRLYCAPGNAGIAEIAECVAIRATDIKSLARFADEQEIDLTLVGPEAPLAAGIVDEFQGRDLRIAGPNRNAARLESSKVFAKDFMVRHRISTARHVVANSPAEAFAIIRSGQFAEAASVVVKADGLAAGKGVVVAASRAESEKAIQDLMIEGLAGAEAARRVIIEEALTGSEASLLLFTDGRDYCLMPAARDYKRVGENDSGANTGGMGSITDASVIDRRTLERAIREIVEPTLEGARADGFPFRGVLYIGLMLTEWGPQVLEYNVRFGDPETQAILVRLQADLVQVFEALVDGRLGQTVVRWSEDSSACVVLAARGYPGKPETEARITGLESAARLPFVQIFHAATARSPKGDWLTAGGRVLDVTATGRTLPEALERCYAAAADIHWDGMHYRRDIGKVIYSA